MIARRAFARRVCVSGRRRRLRRLKRRTTTARRRRPSSQGRGRSRTTTAAAATTTRTAPITGTVLRGGTSAPAAPAPIKLRHAPVHKSNSRDPAHCLIYAHRYARDGKQGFRTIQDQLFDVCPSAGQMVLLAVALGVLVASLICFCLVYPKLAARKRRAATPYRGKGPAKRGAGPGENAVTPSPSPPKEGRCGRCRDHSIRYCSVTCQQSHWETHRDDCDCERTIRRRKCVVCAPWSLRRWSLT